MTVREMQVAFDYQIQLISETMEIADKPSSDIIVYFLNLAQEKYIKENFLSRGQIQDNIEFIQKRSDTLRNIISRNTPAESVTPIAATEIDGGIELELPANYFYYIKSFSYLTNAITSPTTKMWTPNRPIEHYELDKVSNHLYNSPILRKPCVVFEEGDRVILYKDKDTNIYNISFIYLRKPYTLSLDATSDNNPVGYTNECELDEATHRDIIELAVRLFIEDYKYKLSVKQQ